MGIIKKIKIQNTKFHNNKRYIREKEKDNQ